MFLDEFKKRYTTIPFAIYHACGLKGAQGVVSHQHKEMELIAIEEGGGNFYVNGIAYAAKEGDVLLIPPYALHRVTTTEDTVTSYLCICFDLSLLWDKKLAEGLESGTLSLSSYLINGQPGGKAAAGYIAEAFSACEENAIGWEMTAIGNMSLLFGLLKKQGCFTETGGKAEATFAEKAVRYIAEHYASPITSRTAATSLYLNNSYFCRTFKKTFGCRFTDYLLAYRLEKAKVYVRDSHLSITEIAFKVGFHSCSYFDQAFKESVRLSPLAYRKNKRS